MASTVIQPVADRIGVLLEQAGCAVNVWPRDHLPSSAVAMAEIELPDFDRTDPEERESQLGSDDWRLDYLVTVWVKLTEPTGAQQHLAETVETFVSLLDDDRGLNGLALDASVTSGRRVYQINPKDRSPALVGYETTVAVWKLV